MRISTKKGDKGKTGLYGSSQKNSISKDSLIIETIGSIDEANSALGLAKSFCNNLEDEKLVNKIQKDLMTINSIVAGSKLNFSKTKTIFLEKEIDKLEKKLPKLNNFLIPGGDNCGASFELARTIIRRAERRIVNLLNQRKIGLNILSYINRLSDLVFLLSRKNNLVKGEKEETWGDGKK